MARWPSGKAKVCKTFIGGSIPPRASNPKSMLLKQLTLQTSVEQEAQKSEQPSPYRAVGLNFISHFRLYLQNWLG
jgi:hypothetical protein